MPFSSPSQSPPYSPHQSPPASPPPDPDREANQGLLSLLSLPDQSTPDELPSPPSTSEITAANPPAYRPTSGPPPSPVPHSLLQPAVYRYLISRNLSPDDLPTAAPLLAVAKLPSQLSLKRRVRAFAQFALARGLLPADCPTRGDFRYKRCWVRVLYAVVWAAKLVDQDGWDCVREGFDVSLEGGWEAYAKEEAWKGDGFVREMVHAHHGGFCVAIFGTQGAGKSACVNRVLGGRRGIPEAHALAYWGREGETERRHRKIVAVSWPNVPVVLNMPMGAVEVERCCVKVRGGVVRFMELPSMERDLEYVDDLGLEMEAQLGGFESVVEEVQLDLVHYLWVVERMDDICEERFRAVLQKMVRIYGKRALKRMMVLLTHGQAFPPAEMSYSVWVFDRLRLVKEILRKVGASDVPVVVMENSDNCEEQDGRLVLPDGTDFMEKLMEEFSRVAAKTRGAQALKPIPTRKWWEDCVALVAAAFLIMRIL